MEDKNSNINYNKHRKAQGQKILCFFAKINTENKIIALTNCKKRFNIYIQLKPLECKIEIIGTLKY